MSLLHQPLPVPISLQPAPLHRKRTSSFSYPSASSNADSTAFSPNPRPAKSQRITPAPTPALRPMGSPLRRSETMVVIPEPGTANNNNKDYYRVLQRHKDDRIRRKGVLTRSSAVADLCPLTSRPRLEVTSPTPSTQPPASSSSAAPKPRKPSSSSSTSPSFTPTYTKKRAPPPTPPQIILPSASSPITVLRTQRTSSPLAPTRTPLPGRPVFPRSKPEPDLYRTAIKMRMRHSPEGLKILHMGPRLALSIMDATKELEKIVADQREREADGDVVMSDSTTNTTSFNVVGSGSLAMPVLTASWVVVRGDDWEMVDCAA